MTGPERRLARFVEDVLHGRRPRRFRASAEQLLAMRAAAEIRAARPGADLPDPDFLDRLGRRLRSELEGKPRPASVSRRRLLLGAGGTAAAAVAGGVTGVVADRMANDQGAPRELVPTAGTWQPVIAAAAVSNGQAVRFSNGAIEGFVVNHGGRFRAISAVCTHLGCILQQVEAGLLTCPCHRTAFSLDGAVVHHEFRQAPGHLPLLRARVRDGQVEVYTPAGL